MSRAQSLTLPRWRAYLVALAVLCLCGALLWRVTSLQVLPHQDRGFQFLQKQGQGRTLRTEPISAYRGVTTGRNRERRAGRTPGGSWWVGPQVLVDEPDREDARAQAQCWAHAQSAR